MSYFPFFIELQGQRGLIVGGGSVACRRVRSLLEFGAGLTVVAPDFCRPLSRLAEEAEDRARITLVRRSFRESDLDDQLFVIAATDDDGLNHRISQLCRKRHIMVNAVDNKEDCSFYFPALIKRDEIVAGISSGGCSPALARNLCRRLEAAIPSHYPALNRQLGALRTCIRQGIASEERRKQCFEELLAAGEEKQGSLSEDEVAGILKRYL